MTEYAYLEVDDVLGFYVDMMAASEPGKVVPVLQTMQADTELCGCVASQLTRAQNTAHYEEGDFAAQAATLTYGFVQRHCFGDGNKRLAAKVLLGFLSINGFTLAVSDDGLADWILAVTGFAIEDDVTRRVEPLNEDTLAARIRQCLQLFTALDSK